MKIDNIKLINDDCLEIFKKIKSCSVDLFITDPPYKLVSGGCTNNKVRLKGSTDLKSGSVFRNNSIKFNEWIPEVYRVLKEKSHCYIMCNDRNLQELLNESTKAGFKLLNILVWKKTKHSPNRYYLKNAEFIVFLRKGGAKNINNMGSFQVLEFKNVKNKLHPSEKPIDLLECLIKNSTDKDENSVVMDCFMGSGSTGVACINTNRKFIGIELDNEYYKIAKERIENTYSELKEII